MTARSDAYPHIVMHGGVVRILGTAVGRYIIDCVEYKVRIGEAVLPPVVGLAAAKAMIERHVLRYHDRYPEIDIQAVKDARKGKAKELRQAEARRRAQEVPDLTPQELRAYLARIDDIMARDAEHWRDMARIRDIRGIVAKACCTRMTRRRSSYIRGVLASAGIGEYTPEVRERQLAKVIKRQARL